MAHKNALSSKSSNFFGLSNKESLNYGNEAAIQGCVEGAIIDAIFITNKIIESHLSRGDEEVRLVACREYSFLSENKPHHTVVYDKISGFEVLVMEDKKPHPQVPHSKQVAGQIFDYLCANSVFGWASEPLCHLYYRRKNMGSMDEYWQFQ
jgi:hypothetical protein